MLFRNDRNSILQCTLNQDQRDLQKEERAAQDVGACCTLDGGWAQPGSLFGRRATSEAPIFKPVAPASAR